MAGDASSGAGYAVIKDGPADGRRPQNQGRRKSTYRLSFELDVQALVVQVNNRAGRLDLRERGIQQPCRFRAALPEVEHEDRAGVKPGALTSIDWMRNAIPTGILLPADPGTGAPAALELRPRSLLR